MEIKLNFTDTDAVRKRLKVKTARALRQGTENEDVLLDALIDMAAAAMVDDAGAYVDKRKAEALLDELTLGELEEVAAQVKDAFGESIVPKE